MIRSCSNTTCTKTAIQRKVARSGPLACLGLLALLSPPGFFFQVFPWHSPGIPLGLLAFWPLLFPWAFWPSSSSPGIPLDSLDLEMRLQGAIAPKARSPGVGLGGSPPTLEDLSRPPKEVFKRPLKAPPHLRNNLLKYLFKIFSHKRFFFPAFASLSAST